VWPPFDALNQLDQLADAFLEAARRDAEAIRARAEQEAEAELANQRGQLEHRLDGARAELDRIEEALATAARALDDVRRDLMADLLEAVSPAAAAAPEPAPESATEAPATAAAVTPPPASPPTAPEAPPTRDGGAEPATVRIGAAYSGGTLLEQADALLRGGQVNAALDTFRIVGRYPEEIEAVVARLNEILKDEDYAPHQPEVRQILADIYMLQGQPERARTLLRQPGE
jgi:hypothetical protein